MNSERIEVSRQEPGLEGRVFLTRYELTELDADTFRRFWFQALIALWCETHPERDQFISTALVMGVRPVAVPS